MHTTLHHISVISSHRYMSALDAPFPYSLYCVKKIPYMSRINWEYLRLCKARPSLPGHWAARSLPSRAWPPSADTPSPSLHIGTGRSPGRFPFLSSRCFKIFQLFSLLFSENPWEPVTLLLPLPLPAVIGLPHLPTPAGILLPHFHAEILNF